MTTHDARRTTLAVLVRTRNERRNACVTPCFRVCVTKGSAAERSQSLSLNLDMCHERQFRNDVSLAASACQAITRSCEPKRQHSEPESDLKF